MPAPARVPAPAGMPAPGGVAPPRRVLGVDGCRQGWVVVTLVEGAVAGVEVVETLTEALADGPFAAVGVDMPIGLVDGPRAADAAARKLLPGRASSVFSAPPRAVIDGTRDGALTTHAQATARAVAVTGSGISMQAWRLVPKIVEVDELLAAGHPLHEVHPELAFAVLTGGSLPRKRSWAGITTRRAVLARIGVELPDRFPGDEAATPDDVVDAAVCAWVADGIAGDGEVVAVPEDRTQHDRGRSIVITARLPPPVTPGPRVRPRHQ
jgi:predicted RNase H-like nuclease